MPSAPKPKYVKIVRTRGQEYTYFTLGWNALGSPILAPLPALDSPEFGDAYAECLIARQAKVRAGAAAQMRNGRDRAIARASQQKTNEFVYFIVAQSGNIKIGRTTKPLERLQTLQTANSEPLSMVAMTEGGAQLEKELHSRFSEHRMSGEWFQSHPDIWDEIGHIRAFDRPSQWGGTKGAKETTLENPA